MMLEVIIVEFKLNEYHRNVTDEELITDVINAAKKLNKASLTIEEYTKNGNYNHTTLTRRFGNWKNVLQLSNLETNGHNFKCSFSEEDIINDIKRVARIYKKDTITKKEYDAYGNYSSSTIVKKYATSWNRVLELSGMQPVQNRNFSNEQLFSEIERIWIMLGRQPTSTDIKGGISRYSFQSYVRRFGGWRNTLQAFVDYINSEDTDTKDTQENVDIELNNSTVPIKHKTKRDINLRLRFKVMQRDNFKCCICGASPAKDPSVELQIDHIIPWAKGGETTIDNLQTLCTKCNLGKSDLL